MSNLPNNQKFMPNQKGFSKIAIIIIVLILIGVLGYMRFIKKPVSLDVGNQVQLTEKKQIETKQVIKTDTESSREALVSYFNLLNKKQYSDAVKYHGSGYDYLKNWNSGLGLKSNDYESLIKNGCEVNGLQCLKIKMILNQQKISETDFKFIVQFENNDGTLFEQINEDENQSLTKADFEYIVRKTNNQFLVITQPVYSQ